MHTACMHIQSTVPSNVLYMYHDIGGCVKQAEKFKLVFTHQDAVPLFPRKTSETVAGWLAGWLEVAV